MFHCETPYNSDQQSRCNAKGTSLTINPGVTVLPVDIFARCVHRIFDARIVGKIHRLWWCWWVIAAHLERRATLWVGECTGSSVPVCDMGDHLRTQEHRR